MGGKLSRLGLVEFIDQLFKSLGVGEPIAAADVFAEQRANLLLAVFADVGGGASRLAELWELAAFAEVEEMAPDFAAGGLGVRVLGGVGCEEPLEFGGVGQIIRGSADFLV